MRHLSRWVGLAVSVVAVAAVVVWMLNQPAPQLPSSAAGLAWLALALTLALSAIAVRGWRWHRIMTLAHVDHQRTDAMALVAVSYMGNNVLPARGGELLRIAILGKRSQSRRREILGTVVAERLLDAVTVAALFAVLSLGLADSPAGTSTAALVVVAIALGFGGLAVYLSLRRAGRFERFAATVRPVARSLRLFAHPSGLPIVGWSLAAWLLEGLAIVAIARSVGVSLPPQDGLLVLTLSALAAAIPAAPGFAGTYDGAMLLGLKAAGVVGGAASGILILARLVFFMPVTLIGLGLLVVRYGGLRSVYRTTRNAPAAS